MTILDVIVDLLDEQNRESTILAAVLWDDITSSSVLDSYKWDCYYWIYEGRVGLAVGTARRYIWDGEHYRPFDGPIDKKYHYGLRSRYSAAP